MSTLFTSRLAFFSAFVSLAGAGFGAADRIQAPIEGEASVALRESISPRALPGDDHGALDPAARIQGVKLVLGQTGEQAVALALLLEEQRDPASPNYQNWLSPEEFGDRFGVSENDLGRLTSWLESRGFTIDRVARARNWIAFSGTAEQIGGAFRTELRHYESRSGKHFANASAPSIPASLAGVVVAIRGLDDFRPAPPKPTVGPSPDFDANNGYHSLAPGDLATIYDIQALYRAGYDGAGQKLAIAGQTDINIADIRAFRTAFGLAAKDPQLILAGADPGVGQSDQMEADLDVEWAGAVARSATILYVYSPNVFESLQFAIDQNLAPVVSVSYGGCEIGSPLSYRTLAQQANAEGITWVNAAGDSGAAGCDAGAKIAAHSPAVTFPADIPEVTAVGGTEFNDVGASYWSNLNSATFSSALSYIPEKAWNDTALGNGLASGGGGASGLYAKPWWQAGPGVPNDHARDVPDISLAASGAHDAFLIYFNGQMIGLGGTSAASPAFAGIATILNQYLVAQGTMSRPGLGNMNPTLYSLAQGTTGLFHDITSGNNIVPCTASVVGCVAGSYGYNAGPGYDLATGLGSVDAWNLVTRWVDLPSATGTTMTLLANPANMIQSAATQLTATVSAVTGAATPTGVVSFTAGLTPLGAVPVAGAGPTAAAILQIKGSALAAGANSITATFAPTGSFSGATAATTVTVVAPALATSTSLTAAPAGITPAASTLLTAVVRVALGTAIPNGSVAFLLGNTQLGAATLVTSAGGATAALTLKGSGLAMGSNGIVAVYGGAAGFNASTSPRVSVTVTAPVVATTMIVTANPTTIIPAASTAVTAVVHPSAGTIPPIGTVTFTIGNVLLGTVPLSSGGSTAGVTLLIKGASLATGSNTIAAAYSGGSGFGSSAGSVGVIVNAPPVATSLTLAATPASIAPGATAFLTATVKSTSATSAGPTGSVVFTLGNSVLGAVPLAVSGVAETAVLTVKGSSLAVGANTIAAMYLPTGNFSPASAAIVVNVVPPVIATTMAMTANPAKIVSTASTQLTATLRAASGSASPTGTVTFLRGATLLGSVTLIGSGGAATASLTVKGSALGAGGNTITANYAGGGFAAAAASVTVSVTPVSSARFR